jgi:MFS transporter, DHA1 family, tetracycline resistance protein
MRSNRLLTIFLFVQGLAIGHLSKHYTGRQLMLSSAIAVAAGFALWGVVPNLWTLLIVLVPFSFGGGILNTGINSALSKSVYPEEIGGTLGVSASIESLTRVLSPVAGGLLLQWARPWGLALFTAAVIAYVATFVWRRPFVKPDPPLEPRTMSGGYPMSAG